METACVDGHSHLSVIGSYRPGPYQHKGKGVCLRDVCAIYDNNISPSLLIIIIKIIILYFIQIRHTDDFPPMGTLLVLITTIGGTVEPLWNDHPRQRPSLLYDHISCDGQFFLFVRLLTDDHPSDATNDRVRWIFSLADDDCVQCISKHRGWRFNIRSKWWIITMLRSDTFEVIQLL